MKNKLQRLKVDGETYDTDRKICEILNEKFYSVFTKEEIWKGGMGAVTAETENLTSIRVSRSEV